MSRILFLCTGNYYRSRFAEQYFNHIATQRGLFWRADSKALVRDLDATGNRGPISPFALAELQDRGVAVSGEQRWPARVEAPDFERYPRVIALSRLEHEPMLLEHFPEQQGRVEFWEIGDLHIESPEQAIARLADELEAMVAEIGGTA